MCVRKIGPELTWVANLPPFFPSPKPRHMAVHPSCRSSGSSVWDPTAAWPAELCAGLCPGSELANPGCRNGARELNHSATGPAPKLIFVWDMRFRSKFFFFSLWIFNYSSIICCKHDTSPIDLLSHVCQKPVGHTCVALFPGSLFCSIDPSSRSPQLWLLRLCRSDTVQNDSSHFVLSQNCFSSSSSVAFLCTFEKNLVFVYKKKILLGFYQNCVKPVCEFEGTQCLSFYCVKSSKPWALHLLRSCLFFSSVFLSLLDTAPLCLLDLHLSILSFVGDCKWYCISNYDFHVFIARV